MRSIFVFLLLIGIPVQAFGATATCTWGDASSGSAQETNFVLERAPSCSGPWTVIATPAQNTEVYADTTVNAGSTYCYKIKAVNAVGSSAYSNNSLLTVPSGGSLPGVPSNVTCTYSSATAPPPTGLVLALSMNGTGSTTTVADSSGLNNHGTRSGATWSTSGKYGGALSFDGINDWVTVADAASLDLTTGLTMSAWVFPTVTTGVRDILIKQGSGVDVYNLYARNGNGKPESNVFVGGSNRVAEGTALPVNVWTHIAGTYGSGTLKLFINGVQVASTAVSGPVATSTGVLRIGGNSLWNNEFYQGRIDEVRIYNRALTAAEIITDKDTPVTP